MVQLVEQLNKRDKEATTDAGGGSSTKADVNDAHSKESMRLSVSDVYIPPAWSFDAIIIIAYGELISSVYEIGDGLSITY